MLYKKRCVREVFLVRVRYKVLLDLDFGPGNASLWYPENARNAARKNAGLPQNAGMPECQNARMPECWNAGMPECPQV